MLLLFAPLDTNNVPLESCKGMQVKALVVGNAMLHS